MNSYRWMWHVKCVGQRLTAGLVPRGFQFDRKSWSLSAILTSSANDPACILRIT